MNYDFTIITSVYKNDKPEFFRIAMDSMMVNQTIVPSEVVLVVDGQVSIELNSIVNEFETRYSKIFKVIRLEQNKGLGNALMLGVENAKYDLIARMDSDDICLPNRFEIQLNYMKLHPDVDIIGGQITEFIATPNNIISRRIVPLDNESIYRFMRSRCALNHTTVMFRKQAVLNAGNYQDFFWNEDYYLWVRMMQSGCKFANVEDVLVNVRVGMDQYARRGGRKYYESEKAIKKLQLKSNMISPMEYIYFVTQRFIIQILMPNTLRGWLFRNFIRRF